MANNADADPCCYIKSTGTRNGCCCKWLLMKTKGCVPFGHMRGKHRFLLATSTVDSVTVQHLMLTKQGFPLTQEMDDVLDVMEAWGRKKNVCWHKEALRALETSMDEAMISAKDMCKRCISVQVRRIIFERMRLNPAVGLSVCSEWVKAFKDLFDCRTRCCCELCIRSFEHVKICISQAVRCGVLTPCVDSDSEVNNEEEEAPVLPVVVSSSD